MVVKTRLSLTARVARGVALVLLVLQLLAMLATRFHAVATLMAGKDTVTYVAAVVLAVVVTAGCVWAGVQVWQDAGDRDVKKARLYLVLVPLVPLVPAYLVYGYVVGVLDPVVDGVYGPGLRSAANTFPTLIAALVIGMTLQVFLLWLLTTLPFRAIRRLSKIIRTVDVPIGGADDENEVKAPAALLAFLAWTGWLVYLEAGLV
ncbi:hypothetical protein PV379_01745 [Streptomyces caniscabiei]|uniref:hypothetical protein n=1 Tax=Streptomyces caniscabiei TaxID=2746961 RepID=UPI0029B5EABA|nr:hypothetical protein [Streptomyces caniscabiei]MDX2776077.1 hypothetical protein [Streptomyces caniscabiei]